MTLYEVIYNFISAFFPHVDYLDGAMIRIFSYLMTYGFILLLVFGLLKIIKMLFVWGKR